MHLIVFSDGTWNTPDQMDGGLPAPTNVVKLRNALAPEDRHGAEQKVYYHPGVGTDGGWWNRIAGGGMGDGLDKNIMSGYNWLARHYEPGARIWLFGFSRGAYTVRSLAGMISRCGLLDARNAGLSDKAVWSAVEDLFAIYRQKEDDARPAVASARRPLHGVGQGNPGKHSIPIHFIGVWDTVGALGVPDDMALLNLIDDPSRHGFHDTELSPVVLNARHAVAIDEMRQSFSPTLWTNVDGKPTVKQLWFPGAHGNVGGGYGTSGLSDGALSWMMDEAEQLDLGFRPNIRAQLAPDPRGQLHDSVTGIFKSLKTRPRAIPSFEAADGRLHRSALERHEDPPLTQGEYRKTKVLAEGGSATVDIFARELWNDTGIYLEAGIPYRFAAEGEWLDSTIACGPKGTRDGKFNLGEAVQAVSSLFGKGEAIYSRLTGNHTIDFWYTKREEEMPWFALVGVVANGVMPQPTATDDQDRPVFPPHEVFLIGDGAEFTPSQGGYLYGFANDAWQAYDNNHGSVRLTVTRLPAGN